MGATLQDKKIVLSSPYPQTFRLNNYWEDILVVPNYHAVACKFMTFRALLQSNFVWSVHH